MRLILSNIERSAHIHLTILTTQHSSISQPFDIAQTHWNLLEKDHFVRCSNERVKTHKRHITDDHFEIKLIARLLNQIYVVQSPILPLRYDDAPPDEYEYSQPPTDTDGARPSAPQFPEHLHLLLTRS